MKILDNKYVKSIGFLCQLLVILIGIFWIRDPSNSYLEPITVVIGSIYPLLISFKEIKEETVKKYTNQDKSAIIVGLFILILILLFNNVYVRNERSRYISPQIENLAPIVKKEKNKKSKKRNKEVKTTFSSLAERKIGNGPYIKLINNNNDSIFFNICVNSKGEISKVNLDNKKSSTNRKDLIDYAKEKVKEFKFKKADYENDCGFIKINL